MINLNKAKEEFIKYTNTYDLENTGITRKIYHSLRVMEYSKKIAENMNLSEEQVKLATLIGLLHDIARFEQMKRYGTYKDKISIDHGDFAIEILEKDNFIRKFIETDKYDNIIKIAIKNHNKYKIENLEGEELLQSKIIKDADKLDIFFQIANQFSKDVSLVENSEVSEDYIKQIREEKCIYRNVEETPLDEVVLAISFIYDTYFDYSFNIIKEEKFIEKIFAQFNFKKEKTQEQINEIIQLAQKYITKKTEK